MDYGRWLLLLIAGVFICIVCTLENEDCIMALCLHIFFVIARYSQFFVSHTSLGCYDAVAANILCDLRPLQRQTEEYLCAFFCSLILYNLHDGAERKKKTAWICEFSRRRMLSGAATTSERNGRDRIGRRQRKHVHYFYYIPAAAHIIPQIWNVCGSVEPNSTHDSVSQRSRWHNTLE